MSSPAAQAAEESDRTAAAVEERPDELGEVELRPQRREVNASSPNAILRSLRKRWSLRKVFSAKERLPVLMENDVLSETGQGQEEGGGGDTDAVVQPQVVDLRRRADRGTGRRRNSPRRKSCPEGVGAPKQSLL